MKIYLTTDEYGWSKTQCPHANFVLRVGSQVCQKCQHWFGRNQEESYIYCLCPDGETLKRLPGSIS